MKNTDYYVKISRREKDRESREDFLKTLTKLGAFLAKLTRHNAADIKCG